MIGKTISHYKVIEKLGGGGMGVVYKAEDLKLDRPIALKFLPPSFSLDEEAKQRFIHEAKAASALEHNNICNIHEIDETKDGQLFIAMAFYEGETLKKKIEKGPLYLEEAIDITVQTAEGLVKAHKKEIIHRDIKPANLFITNDGVVKILDFGLAKVIGQTQLTKMGSTIGTVAYMSPEQTRGEKVDSRTDIWSLGVMLYEMITGLQPFKGDYEQAVSYSIVNETPEPPTGIRTGVPLGAERIINKCLEKNPSERYQHLDDLIVDLKSVSNERKSDKSIVVGRATYRNSKSKTLSKIIITLAVLALLVSVILVLKPLFLEEPLVSTPRTVVVMPFENQTGDASLNYLRAAIPNLLITNLEQSKYLTVLTWERMQDLLKQMGRDSIEVVNIDRPTGFELCKLDGVHGIVLGSFTRAGEIFATDIKVLDVSNKRALKSVNSRGKGVSSILELQIDALSNDISQVVVEFPEQAESEELRIAEVTTVSMDAYNYFLKGKDEYEKYYWEDALRFFEKSIQLDSTFATAYLYLARTNRVLRNTHASTNAYEKARKFVHKTTKKERMYIEAAYASDVERDLKKRVRILTKILKSYPKEKMAHFYLGVYYHSHGMFSKAIDAFNQTLKLDPNYHRALNFIAYSYSKVKNYKKAFDVLKRYASIHHGEANPFDSMADIYFHQGMLDQAIEKYKESMEVKPTFGSARSLYYILALKEEYDEAKKWLEMYIEKTSSSGLKANGYWWKGFTSFWLGNKKQAMEYLQRSEEFGKEAENLAFQARADWLRAWIYYDVGELKKSRRFFKSYFDFVIEKYPEGQNYLSAYHALYKGLVNLKQGRIDSTRSRIGEINSILQKIDDFQKVEITFYLTLLNAELLLKEEIPEKAIVICQRMVPLEFGMLDEVVQTGTLYYNLTFPRDVLARAFMKIGKIDKAISEYEQLMIVTDPNNKERRLIQPRYHYELGKLYEAKGLKEKAIEEYVKFLQLWKDADKELPDLIDVKKRFSQLKEKTL